MLTTLAVVLSFDLLPFRQLYLSLNFHFASTKGMQMHVFSQVLGWAYFVLWSLSFYPQVIHNYCRRSTDGFSFDFALLNVLGLTAYTVFNGSLLFSDTVRRQYAHRHPQSPIPTVQLNDFVYAFHGTLICCLICSHFLWARFWNFNSKPQRASQFTLVVFGGCLAVVAADVAWVSLSGGASREWVDVVSGCIF
jgi:cystinosin